MDSFDRLEKSAVVACRLWNAYSATNGQSRQDGKVKDPKRQSRMCPKGEPGLHHRSGRLNGQ